MGELPRLTPAERAELDGLLAEDHALWRPLDGPQTEAFNSRATITGYGGAAGGGKTDLAVGLALTKHTKIGIFRQNGTELTGILDRFADVLGSRDGFNGKDRIWMVPRPGERSAQIEFGSFPSPGEEAKYRGRPHDLLVFDEASEMRESAVRFLLGWLRTTDEKQRCRALLTFNPPTSAEGRWVVEFFAPWLDRKHPNPALPGELRWFATIDGNEREVEGPAVIEHGGELLYPQSRTFIPSRIKDNPYLMATGYMQQLQSMPEPLRSQLLNGDFAAGMEDDPFQVIRTSWVEIAQARWKRADKLPPMDSLGVDVAMGGKDNTVLARRHGMWFDTPLVYTGAQSIDGPTIAGWCIAAMRDEAVIHIDLFGVGAQPYGHLMAAHQQVIGVNVGEPATTPDKSGRLRFRNLRSQLWWEMREALDPANNTGICLPPDKRLLADLCAPTWKVVGQMICVATREEIVDRIGRSPDFGSAYCLALMDTPKRFHLPGLGQRWPRDYDPFDPQLHQRSQAKQSRDYDPWSQQPP